MKPSVVLYQQDLVDVGPSQTQPGSSTGPKNGSQVPADMGDKLRGIPHRVPGFVLVFIDMVLTVTF